MKPTKCRDLSLSQSSRATRARSTCARDTHTLERSREFSPLSSARFQSTLFGETLCDSPMTWRVFWTVRRVPEPQALSLRFRNSDAGFSESAPLGLVDAVLEQPLHDRATRVRGLKSRTRVTRGLARDLSPRGRILWIITDPYRLYHKDPGGVATAMKRHVASSNWYLSHPHPLGQNPTRECKRGVVFLPPPETGYLATRRETRLSDSRR